ncbi:hypothetical protein PMAYCL1PPCAC_16489, partial [Pristionchus mayeri]
LRVYCCIVGIGTMVLNVFCLFIIIKYRRIFAINIYLVTLSLQILYLLINTHFNIFLVPFIYARYGGGYCIGFLCSTVVLTFQAPYIFLMVNISGLFVLLLFFRHQSLMLGNIRFRLSNVHLKGMQYY